jgi:iron complex transport system substrate-binding protein
LPTPAPSAAPANTTTVTDIVGRSVTLKAPIERMILGEARPAYLVAIRRPT